MMKKIGIIMGSESDLPVMNEASKFLDEMNLSYDIDIVSAHRTPKKMFAYAENAVKNGINVPFFIPFFGLLIQEVVLLVKN